MGQYGEKCFKKSMQLLSTKNAKTDVYIDSTEEEEEEEIEEIDIFSTVDKKNSFWWWCFLVSEFVKLLKRIWSFHVKKLACKYMAQIYSIHTPQKQNSKFSQTLAKKSEKKYTLQLSM